MSENIPPSAKTKPTAVLISPPKEKKSNPFLSAALLAIGSFVIGGESLFKGQILERDLALALIVFIWAVASHKFLEAAVRQYKPKHKDILTISIVVLSTLLIIKVSEVFVMSLIQYLKTASEPLNVSRETLNYALPYAVGALLIQAVLGLAYSLAFIFFFLGVSLVYLTQDIALLSFITVSCLIVSLTLSKLRTRSTFLKAGVRMGVVGIIFSLSSVVLVEPVSSLDFVLRIFTPLVGGILSAIIASGIAPVVEAFGGYVTDMRLMELGSLEHPLLKQLSVQAPGTWNHSMVMGMMAEAAAEAIGANPILARVGAYYHDIGKLKKPLYFVENQPPGENKHDKLSPSMSALIIRSHVKDGIELAKQYHLPKAIIDMIPQHHGTACIEYFYEKAREEAKSESEDPDRVDKSLYSYPGPKPQTKEAAILMLADGIEAAVRTLEEPTEDRIQGLVQKMINKVFASGELNESELTLHDLHLAAKSFTRVLTSIYHQRIAYEDQSEKKSAKSKEGKKSQTKQKGEKTAKPQKEKGKTADADRKGDEEKSASNDEKEDKDSSSGDLKRLGI
ncbi:MAG: HDIG domain-containing protein [Candidatus Dadabacteria bacterium]|nr:MAG: HDIG domain-containing protein [Candidatus Dadabacteria bacterium]